MDTVETFDMPEKIRLLCAKRDMQFKQLAEQSGQTNQNLYGKMSRKDWKLSEIKRVLDVLNAELQLQIIDKETGKPFSI